MMTKTQLVINHIIDNIQWQIYRVGSKVPSVRVLAKELGVSPYTVVTAYDSLVAQGYLTAIKGSGYFVATPNQPQQSPTSAVNLPTMTGNVLETSWLLQHLFNNTPAERASGTGLLSSDWLYPADKLAKAHKKASQSLQFVYNYGNIQGYLPLREQLARQLAESHIHTHPETMLTTTGVSSAIELIARAMCKVGDTVLVDDPTWFWIIGCLQQLGLNVIGIERNEKGINLDELEQALNTYRPKLYITNSVLHNPTGYNLPPSNVFDVLKLMEQHDCYIVEDDVYHYFCEDKTAMRYATLDGIKRVFYVTGVSKILGAGWRVGLIASPEQHLEKLLRQKMFSNMTTPELTERPIYQIWQDSYYKKHLSQIQQRLSLAHASLQQRITQIGLSYPTGVRQGLFAWVDVGMDSRELALQAHKDNWLVAPSHLFSPTARYQTHIRLNVTRTSDEFLAWLKAYLIG
ncbi:MULTISPECIES: PLP-dependent aminotransferase family protein [unclassified Moraxella]|uniref:aminotransferase-like domain-containing protein n=1 Tax=unclassified Moraxella TaxID=2685852 RepID=UPI003AF6004A